MNWRPYLVVLSLVLSLVLSVGLIGQERIPELEVKEEVLLRNEPLRNLNYSPNTRLANFQEMGLDADLAGQAAELAVGLQRHRERYTKLLEQQALEVGDAFCPTPSGLPQPYAATRYLVIEEGGRRDVIDAHNMLLQFEEQPWYARAGTVLPVYNTLERSARRRSDATIMGVSAILLGREIDAINERSAWSAGVFGVGASGFRSLESDSPRIRKLVAEYFALVHYLTELANDQDGICQ